MQFTLGQYDYTGTTQNAWMSPITTNIIAGTVLAPKETEDYSDNNNTSLTPTNCFYDIGFKKSNDFSVEYVYYCQIAIKRTNTTQEYNIKLADDNPENNQNNYMILKDRGDTQYIKNISVAPYTEGQNEKWFYTDFVFNPYINYNLLYFDMVRIDADYKSEGAGRLPEIILLELSQVNTLQKEENIPTSLLKIGVQSNPGLRMSINHDEIYIGRTGVYEFKHNDIKISSIGMITPAQSWAINNEKKDINNIKLSLKEYSFDKLYSRDFDSNLKKYITYVNRNSKYHYYKHAQAERVFQPFTLDYVYEYQKIASSATLEE